MLTRLRLKPWPGKATVATVSHAFALAGRRQTCTASLGP